MVEFKSLIGIILIAFAITLPFACSSGEWKYWTKSWFFGMVLVVLIVLGLKLMGVR